MIVAICGPVREVDSLSIRPRSRFDDEILALRIDEGVGVGLAIQDIGTHHARPLPVRNLDCRLADRPYGAGDQDDLPGLHFRGVDQRRACRKIRDPDGSRLRHREVRRFLGERIQVHDDILGMRSIPGDA